MNGIGGAGMSGELAIEAAGLQKSFGPVRVLDGVDLAVPQGIVFALLGPNGAGKTTTVRILATLTRADAGRARVAGHDVERERREVRRSISLAGQYAAVDGLQTGAENLRMVGRLSGLPAGQARRRADDLLTRFGLANAGNRRVGTYSGGMRRRLDLAASLTGSPSVIFLDEPTTGLDPQSRVEVWNSVRQLAGQGSTVLLTTQNLDEAEHLADRIAILHQGRIIASGTLAELKQLFPPAKVEYVEKQPSLEDIFLAITGHEGADSADGTDN
jgi:ABC-2 type transport system ATP-binding protein